MEFKKTRTIQVPFFKDTDSNETKMVWESWKWVERFCSNCGNKGLYSQLNIRQKSKDGTNLNYMLCPNCGENSIFGKMIDPYRIQQKIRLDKLKAD